MKKLLVGLLALASLSAFCQQLVVNGKNILTTNGSGNVDIKIDHFITASHFGMSYSFITEDDQKGKVDCTLQTIHYGDEVYRIKDKRDHESCLGLKEYLSNFKDTEEFNTTILIRNFLYGGLSINN